MARRGEWLQLFEAVEAQGWRVRRVAHGWLCHPADRRFKPVRIGGTPSDYRAVRNARAALRRAGLSGV